MEFNSEEYNKEIERLKREISALRSEIGYWKKLHERALEREEKLKTELADKNARISYLEHQLYNKKTERTTKKNEKTEPAAPGKRPRGHQKGTPAHQRRTYEDLEERVEVHDLPEGERMCPVCGKPFRELPVTEDSEVIEIEVKGYKRKIKRKKYVEACQCRGSNRIILAPGPCKLIAKSKIGIKLIKLNFSDALTMTQWSDSIMISVWNIMEVNDNGTDSYSQFRRNPDRDIKKTGSSAWTISAGRSKNDLRAGGRPFGYFGCT